MAQDSSRPDFWDTRYRGGVTPWDAAGVPPQLAVWLRTKQAALRALIPGCGSGYEVRAFAAHGHDVLAIDFSQFALEAARRELGALSDRVSKADFFSFAAQPFDIVYERAFLCALPRRLWPAWARRVGELVRPEGELAGFYYLDDNQRGPPFGICEDELKRLLEPEFELAERLPVPPEHSLPVFQGKEVWQVWRRRL